MTRYILKILQKIQLLRMSFFQFDQYSIFQLTFEQ